MTSDLNIELLTKFEIRLEYLEKKIIFLENLINNNQNTIIDTDENIYRDIPIACSSFINRLSPPRLRRTPGFIKNF